MITIGDRIGCLLCSDILHVPGMRETFDIVGHFSPHCRLGAYAVGSASTTFYAHFSDLMEANVEPATILKLLVLEDRPLVHITRTIRRFFSADTTSLFFHLHHILVSPLRSFIPHDRPLIFFSRAKDGETVAVVMSIGEWTWTLQTFSVSDHVIVPAYTTVLLSIENK